MARKTRSEAAGAELAQSLLGPTFPTRADAVTFPTSSTEISAGDLELPPPDDFESPAPGTRVPGLPRTPEGYIDNCSLANGELESTCQMCKGACPDAALFEKALNHRAPTDKAPPPLFATAHAGPGINPDMQRIVESLYAVDAFKDYADLEQNLEVGDERANYSTLMKHLDKAESRARRAHALYLGAKLELAAWEHDSKKVVSAMRTKATELLEDEKATGGRKKAITNADVEARMSDEFPDEWAAQELTRTKLKGTTEHLERLADIWRGRCHSLGTMLSNLRK